MPGSYRCIVLAAVGWLILAAQTPGQPAGQRQAEASSQIADSLRRSETAPQKPDEAPAPNLPCEEGEDDRQSGLCAQWKAADAARDSANAVFWFGMVGAVIGLLTLAAAGSAAWFARLAADHTAKGANEAKRQADAAANSLEISQAHLRAFFSPENEEVERLPSSNRLLVKLTVKNSGSTAGHKPVFELSSYFFGKSEKRENLTKGWFRPGTAGAGAENLLEQPIDLSEEQISELIVGEGVVFVEVNAPYTDIFGQSWHYYHRLRIDGGALQKGRIWTDDCTNTRTVMKRDEDSGHQPKLL